MRNHVLLLCLLVMVLPACGGIVEVDPIPLLTPGDQPLMQGVGLRVERATQTSPATFELELSAAGALTGAHRGWCVDPAHAIQPGAWYVAHLYSSHGEVPAGIVTQPSNLELINYVINTFEPGMFIDIAPDGADEPEIEALTRGDLQHVYWALAAGGTSTSVDAWSQLHVDRVLTAAHAHGVGFVPDCGQRVGVLAVAEENLDEYGYDDVQVVMAEVEVSPVDCL